MKYLDKLFSMKRSTFFILAGVGCCVAQVLGVAGIGLLGLYFLAISHVEEVREEVRALRDDLLESDDDSEV